MISICYANTIEYDFPLQQRPHHIMNILSKRGYKVHWINAKKVEGKLPERISDNLCVYYNWNVFKKRNPNIDIYFSSWSHRHVDLDVINAKLVVYDSLDNFELNESQENSMINKADVLLSASNPLYNLRSKQHNNIYMCRNGCFPELGNQEYEVPKEIANLPKPIILFSGALSPAWCDLELIHKVSKMYTTVVIGMPWGRQAQIDSVHYVNSKPYNELQAFYHHCDVNILPFKRCQVADYSNPIKNYEAMSHGKITVATDIPEATIYPEIVLPSSSHISFLNNIKRALKVKDNINIINKCKQTAKDNSWYERVDVIENAIYDCCEVKNIDME